MSNLIFGFTGTRHGMTVSQRASVQRLFEVFRPLEAHHGDCIGADTDFHRIAELNGAHIVIHPPTKYTYRAFNVGDVELRPKPYLDRNDDIVAAADVLIATPQEFEAEPRGGTWYTIRKAHDEAVECWIVWPGGRAEIR